MLLKKRKSILDLQSSYYKGVRNVFFITSAIVLGGNLIDILKFSQENNFIVWLNVINIVIVIIALATYYVKKSIFKFAFSLVLYSIYINILIGKFVNSFQDSDPLRVNFYLRDSLFIIFILTTAAFSLNKIHSFIIGISYLIVSVVFAYSVNNTFLYESLLQIVFVMGTYVFLTYYLVNIFEKALSNLQEKNILIREQNEYLNETNSKLIERQQIIEEQSAAIEKQSKKLQFQSEELQEKNKELGKLNASKDVFFSIIAHDLKNPFNIVMGYSEMLLKNFYKVTDEKKISYVKSIHSTSLKIYSLFENLLSWALSQTNRLLIKPEKICLNVVINEVAELYRSLLNEKSIELVIPDNGQYYCYADMQMLSIVFRNIVSNAIKFTPVNGKIKISFNEKNDYIFCEIQDTGVGIDPKLIPEIFNIEQHHLNTGTDGEKGTGLGLKLCKVFIEKNNGDIKVTSKINEGTCFSISIPKMT